MKTRSILPLLAVTAVTAAPVVAQDTAASDANPFAPSEELEAYAPFLGEWAGGGNVIMAPGADPLPWTATVVFEPILGGQCVQETMTVTAAGMGQMDFTTWYAFDRERGAHRAVGLSSMGSGSDVDVHWVGEGKMVVGNVQREAGQVMADRTVYAKDGDSWTVTMYRSIDGAPEFVHVTGEFDAIEGDPETTAIAAAADKSLKARGELDRLSPIVGTWSLSGKMRPMPGMPEVELSGIERIWVGPGGTHLVHHITGEAGGGPAYEAYAGSYWDAEAKCYHLVMVDNMGGISASEGRFTDDHTIVYASATTMMGVPHVSRTTLTLEDGGIAGVTSDSYFGAGESTRIFDAKYTRK